MLDILIKNGEIVDGTGKSRFKADIGILNSRIEKVSPIINEEANETIDARGFIVSPGFIDIHAHTDLGMSYDTKVFYKIKQGITTDLSGNCGLSVAPRKKNREQEKSYNFKNFSEYIKKLETIELGINVASLIGHGTVRDYVVGFKEKITASEIERMKKIIDESMFEGAFGLSTGLVYAPGCYADTQEIIDLCKIVSKYDGIYTTHMRGLRETFVVATKEAIKVGEEANLPVQLSHYVPQYGGWGLCKKGIPLIEDACSRGLDVTFDIHLDTVGGTSIGDALPVWVKDGGINQLAARLKEKEVCNRLKSEMPDFIGPGTSGLIKHGKWDIIRITGGLSKNNRYLGKTIKEVIDETGKDPFEVLFDLIVDEGTDSFYITGLYNDEDDIRYTLRNHLSMVATDAAFDTKWDIKAPRTYSTMPRLLGKYVREEKLLSLEEAVKKITYAPAQRMGLKDRGIITKGAWADITIFDLETILEGATDKEFLEGKDYKKTYPTGVKFVIINGKIVINNGEFTGILSGRALRRGD
jgi:N-acyl-D-amino-acid deacylase